MSPSHWDRTHLRRLLAFGAVVLLLLGVAQQSSARRRVPAPPTYELSWQGSGSFRYDSLISDQSVNCKTSLNATGDYSFADTWRFKAQVTGKTFTLIGAPTLVSGPFETKGGSSVHFTGSVTRDVDADACFGLIKPRPGGPFNCTGTNFKAILPHHGPQGGQTQSGDIVGPLSMTFNSRLHAVLFGAKGWEGETGDFSGTDPRPNGCEWWNVSGFTPDSEAFLTEPSHAGFLVDFSDVAAARPPKRGRRTKPIESRPFSHSRAGFSCLPISDHNSGDSCLVEKDTFKGTLELSRVS